MQTMHNAHCCYVWLAVLLMTATSALKTGNWHITNLSLLWVTVKWLNMVYSK